jgi:hypothetical protein
LFEFETCAKSHKVERLDIFLENDKKNKLNMRKLFDEQGTEQELLRVLHRTHKLTGWFKLNQTNPAANNLTYVQIPYHYVWNTQLRKWTPRQRRENKIVPRLYNVSPHCGELFYMRTLLQYVVGAKCYADVRTVDGVVYPTYLEACKKKNLIKDDKLWELTLEDAVKTRMPDQIRYLFFTICVECNPTNHLELWNKFKDSMIEDFQKKYPNASAADLYHLALNHLNDLFQDRNAKSTNTTYYLPMPDEEVLERLKINKNTSFNNTRFTQDENAKLAKEYYAKLNKDQKAIFDEIIANALSKDLGKKRCFFLKGAGGTGKTFLFEVI